MENSYGRSLVKVIGGDLKPDENRKAWLARIAEASGLSVRQVYAVYYREYASKSVIRTLQKATQQAVKTDDIKFIADLEKRIAHLEAVDPDFHRPDIDAGREFLACYRRYAEGRIYADVSGRDEDDRNGGASE